jgi:hypothetical protein
MVGILLFPALAALFVIVGMTRPGPNRMFRGRYRRRARVRLVPRNFSDPTAGIRDPSRPL